MVLLVTSFFHSLCLLPDFRDLRENRSLTQNDMLDLTPTPGKVHSGSAAAPNANHMFELCICISTHLFKLRTVFHLKR